MAKQLHFSTRRAMDRAEDEAFLDARFCNVAAAVIGGIATVGAAAMAPGPPDYSGMNQAAEQQAQLSQEQLDWSKQIYADTAPDREKATQLAFDQAQLQNEAAQKQIQAADDSLAYQQGTFRPVEQKLASDALAYDTPARREAAAAAASADVQTNADAQQQATMRDLERTGAAPNSGRVMAMRGMQDIATAAAKAGAANVARNQVESMGTAKLADVANLGRNIASNQVAQLQSGVQAGNSATGAAATGNAVNMSGVPIMQQGFAGASNSLASAGSIYGSLGNLQNQDYLAASKSNDALWSSLGSAAGKYAASPSGSATISSIFSDEKMKERIRPASDQAALEAVRATPNKTWRYKPGSAGDDGGKEHVGPMAQMVAAKMGVGVAPGGKQIDLVNMNGVVLGAVRALDKKLSKVAAAAGLDALNNPNARGNTRRG